MAGIPEILRLFAGLAERRLTPLIVKVLARLFTLVSGGAALNAKQTTTLESGAAMVASLIVTVLLWVLESRLQKKAQLSTASGTRNPTP